MLEHFVTVEDIDELEYERLVKFSKENVPTTDRSTPSYREQSYNEEKPTKLTFRFRSAEQAMAFKLIL